MSDEDDEEMNACRGCKKKELNKTEMETSLIAKNLLFMKSHKLPSSRMTAIKDRRVCVPVDDDTIKQTLQSQLLK